MHHSTYLTSCRNEIQISPKITALPSGTLSQTLDFKKFRRARHVDRRNVLSTQPDKRGQLV